MDKTTMPARCLGIKLEKNKDADSISIPKEVGDAWAVYR